MQREEEKPAVGDVSDSGNDLAQDPCNLPAKPTRDDSEEGPRPRLSSAGTTSTAAGDGPRVSSVGVSTGRPRLSFVGRGGEVIGPQLSSVGSSFTATGDQGQPSTHHLKPSTSTDRSSENTKTPSSVSLAESVQSTTHSECPCPPDPDNI